MLLTLCFAVKERNAASRWAGISTCKEIYKHYHDLYKSQFVVGDSILALSLQEHGSPGSFFQIERRT